MTPPDPNRRDPATRSAILQAALMLCQEKGYGKVTVEGVARRAGAGKQTIYRWWPSLAAVVMEALYEAAGESRDFPNTGDLRADLRGQMRALVRLMNSPAMAPYTGLIAAAQADPDLARELYTKLIEPRVADCAARIAQAQDDGEVRSDLKPAQVVEMIYAPLYYRLLLHSRKVTDAQVDAVLDIAFAGVSATGRD